MAGDEVGEAAGLLGLGEELLHRLLGHAGAAPELGGALAGLAVEGGEGRGLRVDGRHLLRRVDGGDQELVLLLVAHRNRPVVAVEQQPHPGRPSLDRTDRGHGAHLEELVRRDVLHVLALRDDEDLLVLGAQRGLDGTQGSGAPRSDG